MLDTTEDKSISWYSSEAGKLYTVPVIQSAQDSGYNQQLQTLQYVKCSVNHFSSLNWKETQFS